MKNYRDKTIIKIINITFLMCCTSKLSCSMIMVSTSSFFFFKSRITNTTTWGIPIFCYYLLDSSLVLGFSSFLKYDYQIIQIVQLSYLQYSYHLQKSLFYFSSQNYTRNNTNNYLFYVDVINSYFSVFII